MEESLKVTLSFQKLVCVWPLKAALIMFFNAQMINEINSWVHISDTGKQGKLCVTAASSPEPLLAPLYFMMPETRVEVSPSVKSYLCF